MIDDVEFVCLNMGLHSAGSTGVQDRPGLSYHCKAVMWDSLLIHAAYSLKNLLGNCHCGFASSSPGPVLARTFRYLEALANYHLGRCSFTHLSFKQSSMRWPFSLHHTHDSGHDSMLWLGSLQPMHGVLSSDAGCMGFLTTIPLRNRCRFQR